MIEQPVLFEDMPAAEDRGHEPNDCVACSGYAWYSEARRWKSEWWQADQERLVYLWLLCQMVRVA